MTNFLFKISLSVLLISATMPTASAQSRQAQKGWAQISAPIRACLNTTLEPKKLTVEQLSAAGISPSDERISPLVTSCNQIMAAQLQTNIPCNVTNSKGQQVQSICNQVFAKDENGQIFEVSRDDFLRAAGNGEKVQIAILETSVANAARLEGERRVALAGSNRSVPASSPLLKKPAPVKAPETLKLISPKGNWTLITDDNNSGTSLLRGKIYIGEIEREGDSISFGAFVIPNVKKDVFVPYYSNGQDGWSYDTTSHVLWGWAICKDDEIYFNKVVYYKGSKPNYTFIKSVSYNDRGISAISAYHQVMSAFKVGKISDENNIISNEIRNYCSR